mmetsp:Transcript_4162/g.10802  ORF Transcript_4162/g.10802 Transcript_4162/m.10802 type:complete len:214 (-) Transcript_4162:309-950(-)
MAGVGALIIVVVAVRMLVRISIRRGVGILVPFRCRVGGSIGVSTLSGIVDVEVAAGRGRSVSRGGVWCSSRVGRHVVGRSLARLRRGRRCHRLLFGFLGCLGGLFLLQVRLAQLALARLRDALLLLDCGRRLLLLGKRHLERCHLTFPATLALRCLLLPLRCDREACLHAAERCRRLGSCGVARFGACVRAQAIVCVLIGAIAAVAHAVAHER